MPNPESRSVPARMVGVALALSSSLAVAGIAESQQSPSTADHELRLGGDEYALTHFQDSFHLGRLTTKACLTALPANSFKTPEGDCPDLKNTVRVASVASLAPVIVESESALAFISGASTATSATRSKTYPVLRRPTITIKAEPIEAPIIPLPAGDSLGITAAEFAAWSKVAVCEEGGNWQFDGPVFSGGLGIRNTVWIAYGGLQFAPRAGLATPYEQIFIAKKIQANPPDQNGCAGSW